MIGLLVLLGIKKEKQPITEIPKIENKPKWGDVYNDRGIGEGFLTT